MLISNVQVVMTTCSASGTHSGGSSSIMTLPGVSGGRGACSGAAGRAGETVAELADLRPDPGGAGLSTLGMGGGGGGADALRMSSKQLSVAAGPFSSWPPASNSNLHFYFDTLHSYGS